MKTSARVYRLENSENNVLAMANVTVNDEFVLHNLRVVNSKNGEFVQFPAVRDENGEYSDVIFPITADARKQIVDEVLKRFKEPIATAELQMIGKFEEENGIIEEERVTAVNESSGLYWMKSDIPTTEFYRRIDDAKAYFDETNAKNFKPNENSAEAVTPSSISVSLKSVNGKKLKAVGQVVLDDSVVIKDVRVYSGNKEPFVQMPSYLNKYGEYRDYANAVTSDAYYRMKDAVLDKYNSIAQIQGATKNQLGNKADLRSMHGLDSEYAKMITDRLKENGIKYNAIFGQKTVITINKEQLPKYKEIADTVREQFERADTECMEPEM